MMRIADRSQHLRQKSFRDSQNLFRLWRLVFWAESSAPVRPGVEARPVPQVVPGLLLQLDCGADLLEVPGYVNHAKHGDEQEDDGLEHDVEGKDEIDVGDPGIAPPLRS